MIHIYHNKPLHSLSAVEFDSFHVSFKGTEYYEAFKELNNLNKHNLSVN